MFCFELDFCNASGCWDWNACFLLSISHVLVVSKMHQATELVMQFFYISLSAKVVYKTHQVTELLRDEKKDPAGNSFSSHQVTELVLRFFLFSGRSLFIRLSKASSCWACFAVHINFFVSSNTHQAAELVMQCIHEPCVMGWFPSKCWIIVLNKIEVPCCRN